MITAGVDILENDIIERYPGVIDILLQDRTTQRNIFWATDNYKELGREYSYLSEITSQAITGVNGHIIMPRIKKARLVQKVRARNMAEVYTPSWLCNVQNNLIDNAWFERDNIFNKEIISFDGTRSWIINRGKVIFPKNKSWKSYIADKRLEVACGEAPYIVSRYDSTTGEFISLDNRIGILDRKLRIINENVNTTSKWLDAAQTAYKSTYAYEWQGDSLLLAREAMLITFIENYFFKFGKQPVLRSIKNIANIISWNIWQMDGMKGVIPNSCGIITKAQFTLFGETRSTTSCEGCIKDDISKHNGIYVLIKDWSVYRQHKVDKI